MKAISKMVATGHIEFKGQALSSIVMALRRHFSNCVSNVNSTAAYTEACLPINDLIIKAVMQAV